MAQLITLGTRPHKQELGRVANPRPVAKIKTGRVSQPITDAAHATGRDGLGLQRDPGGLFTIGRTTGVRPTLVVRHPCDVEGYSRSMSHVRQPHAGRKFDRRSTTSTDMSYDL